MLRKCSLTLWRAVLVSVLLLGAVPVRADDYNGWFGFKKEENRGPVRLLTTVPIPGSLKPLRGFDISFVDQHTQLYYLADRSNASVDVVDAKTNTFVKQIFGRFAGVVFNAQGAADNARSGPNGVVAFGRWLFVTDAKSRVVTIDLTTDLVVSDVSTGGADSLRADELAYDPQDGIILAVNNADDPSFATLISVDKNTGKLTVGKRITFDAASNGFDATNGAEQPVWEQGTGKFYLSIPEVDCPNPSTNPVCGGLFPDGAVVRIDPHSTGNIEAKFPVKNCQPAGLTVGPKEDLLLGCSQAFDTAGNAWSASDANSAAPISVIMDAVSGNIDKNVAGVSGNDEVWFNRGDGNYYLAARNQPGGPVLGIIDAKSQTLDQVVPTINTAGKANAYPSGSSHSVAVNSHNNHALVPLPANNVFPNCLNGCIAVFGVPWEDQD